jgi:hypothetical protein
MTIFDAGPTRDRNDATAELGRIGTIAVGFAGLMGVIACMGAVHLGTLGAAVLLVLWTGGVSSSFMPQPSCASRTTNRKPRSSSRI